MSNSWIIILTIIAIGILIFLGVCYWLSSSLCNEAGRKILEPINNWLESNTDESEFVLDTELSSKAIAILSHIDSVVPNLEQLLRKGIYLGPEYQDEYNLESSYDILESVVKVHIKITKKTVILNC